MSTTKRGPRRLVRQFVTKASSGLAREHGGQFTRAVDGLALRKFFGLPVGNIFATMLYRSHTSSPSLSEHVSAWEGQHTGIIEPRLRV